MMLDLKIALLFSCICIFSARGQYEPAWASLDTRPLPDWYDEAKIGIFIHWGVFSVPSFGSEWFWESWKGQNNSAEVNFMQQNYRPDFTYQDFGPMFTAEFFDANAWVDIFKASGANYIVLTSKHHEGFTNWPSKRAFSWNSMDVGPNRDLVGELERAIKTNSTIRFGLYHSLFEWFNPLYLDDKAHGFQTSDFVDGKTMPELYEIVTQYKPDVIWSDGDWEAPDWYWNSTKFIAWLFNESPVRDTVVTNDRWGINVSCHHGSFYTCSDRYNPGVLQPHKWEDAMTLDKGSWGYRRNAPATDYLTIEELLTTITTTVSCGGNILINVGPTHDGMIPAIMEERLRQMGEWLNINGEAIYATTPWTVQNDTFAPNVWYTSTTYTVYGIVLSWPEDDVITLGSVAMGESTDIKLLGDTKHTALKFKEVSDGLQINFPDKAQVESQWAYVLSMGGVFPVQN